MLEAVQPPKSLPQSEESERAVLAGVLLDPSRLPMLSGRLVATDFFSERHRVVYQAMLDVQATDTEIDLRTLQARLVDDAMTLGKEIGGVQQPGEQSRRDR